MIASKTYVHPDGYPAANWIEWGAVPVVDPLKSPLECIDKFHSVAAPREKVNGWLRYPFLLSVAACVRSLRYHHSRNFLREGWELWAVWSKMIEGWTIDPQDCAVIFLGISGGDAESVEGHRLTVRANVSWMMGCGMSSRGSGWGYACAASATIGSAEQLEAGTVPSSRGCG